jgi:hypothetical protein
MKELYIVCYDETLEHGFSPPFAEQGERLSNYLYEQSIQKIVFDSFPIALQLIEKAVKQLHIPFFIHNAFTQQVTAHCAIIAAFEEELLLPASPVVFIMKKEDVLLLLQYIDPFFLETEAGSFKSLELFYIICDQDHIGIERLWKPLRAL